MSEQQEQPQEKPGSDNGIVNGFSQMNSNDSRLIRRAIRERWPVTPEIRAICMQHLQTTIKGERTGPRSLRQRGAVNDRIRLMAVEAAIKADMVNVAAEKALDPPPPQPVNPGDHPDVVEQAPLTLQETLEAIESKDGALNLIRRLGGIQNGKHHSNGNGINGKGTNAE